MRNTLRSIFVASALALSAGAQAVTITTDVITVVDESGSMSGEHAWLPGMISSLDSALAAAAGADPFSALYGLTGFGGNSSHLPGHTHMVGGAELGSVADFGTAASGLTISGGFEDGYSGIDNALNYSSLRAGAVTNIILVTDEDRDILDAGLNYNGMLSDLGNQNALLNAVLNVSILCGDGSRALGMDSGGVGYRADGSGGFTTCSGANTVGGFGTSIANYANLAFATGGAVWDLNQLRIGGMTADSFTSAFVDVKVTETVNRPVPAPASLLILGTGLLGFAMTRRRKANV